LESNYPAGTQACSISGTVTNSMSGLAMQSTLVELYEGATLLRSTYTDSAGYYEFCIQPAAFPATYTVKASAARSTAQEDVTFTEVADVTKDLVILWEPQTFHVSLDGDNTNDGLTETTAWTKSAVSL
jgi:hypothetical protein